MKTLLAIGLGILLSNSTAYTSDVMVLDVQDDLVVVEESDTGMLWDFYGGGYEIGDNLTVVFNNGGVDYTRLDDEIIFVFER